MSRAKKKSPSPHQARTALALCGLTVAGAIGATVWLGSRNQRGTAGKAPVLTESVGRATNFPGANSSNAAPSLPDPAAFVAWLTNRTDAAELLNAGNSLLGQGWAGQAMLCYRQAIELKPGDEEAHFSLGVAYSRMGQDAEAEQSYRQALKLFPEYAEARNNLGSLLRRQKRYPEAVAEFKEALKTSPDNASAHNHLGRTLAEQGALPEAVEHFAEAARLDTNSFEARFNLANASLNLGRTNDAISAFRETLRLRPNFEPAAQALRRLGQLPQP